MSTAIALRALTKTFGTRVAAHDVTLEVAHGSVCGLLGPNGAGKTTTFRCLLGFARPTSGEVLIDGRPVGPATFERLAFVPERPSLFPGLTVAQHLEFVRRNDAHWDGARAEALRRMFDLPPAQRARRLSKGQQTALGIVLAFARRPAVLVLDEPTSGLDPIHQRQVLDLVVEAAADGTAVLFSSHQIGHVERAADRVAVMVRGTIVLDADVEQLRAREKTVEAVFPGGIPDLDGTLVRSPVGRIERVGTTLRVVALDDAEALRAQLSAAGASSARVLDRTLEDIFLDAVAAGGAPARRIV